MLLDFCSYISYFKNTYRNGYGFRIALALLNTSAFNIFQLILWSFNINVVDRHFVFGNQVAEDLQDWKRRCFSPPKLSLSHSEGPAFLVLVTCFQQTMCHASLAVRSPSERLSLGQRLLGRQCPAASQPGLGQLTTPGGRTAAAAVAVAGHQQPGTLLSMQLHDAGLCGGWRTVAAAGDEPSPGSCRVGKLLQGWFQWFQLLGVFWRKVDCWSWYLMVDLQTCSERVQLFCRLHLIS